MALKITFHGGAETVTGSNFLIQTDTAKAKTARGGSPDTPLSGVSRVLVDCGVEQGSEYSKRRAYEPFPYNPKEIHALVITHAHLDHVGRAPRLVREGFRGKVYMTPPTRDLAELILRDSVDILAENAKRHGLPLLYEEKDVEAFLSHVELLPYHEEREIVPGLSVYLRNTGHILGSASVRFKTAEASLAITSDIGNSPSPLLPDVEPIDDADAIVMESVYGDKHVPEKEHRVKIFKESLRRALARALTRGGQGGTIMIPAFSMERTQLMLYELSNFFSAKEIPEVPVFLDSPLAIAITNIYRKWAKEYFKKDAQQKLAKEGDILNFPFLKMTRSREESEAIAGVKGRKIIIAGAGMSHGGRIGRHEARYLPDKNSTLFIVGYQAPGSPGRILQDGGKRVRINGHEVQVRAKVETLHGWSAHADRDGLLKFAESCLPRTKTFFTALGEPSSARFLAQRIHGFLGRPAIVPMEGQSFRITKEGARFEK
ncbi:MBL fold metallo-hydrolase [Candidatus Parcubacteria bacterium]|nr:MBL fold metallo-hydrolase [Candidatus Parcubacteria bacterium]